MLKMEVFKIKRSFGVIHQLVGNALKERPLKENLRIAGVTRHLFRDPVVEA